MSVFTILRHHVKRYKRQHDSFHHSLAGQHQRHVDYLTSNSMDQLKNIELIEQLCRKLRRQREEQSATTTG